MKLLPHYFKWIGLGLILLSIVFGFDDFRRGFMDGITGKPPVDNFESIMPDILSQSCDYLILSGLLLYILSKNKTEDEFAQKLRYESAFIVLILTIGVLFFAYIINSDIKVSPAYVLLLQMLVYLIVRAVKRSVILEG